MAEQIISPGVFTRENDLSFLPQGVGAIGAAIVGPTIKGPAFVPTVVKSFSEFERRFGPLSSNTFVPQTVREYLRNAGSVTVCRVLGGGTYTYANGTNEVLALVAGSAGSVSEVAAKGNINMARSAATLAENGGLTITSSNEEVQIAVGGAEYRFIVGDPGAELPQDSGNIFYYGSGSTYPATVVALKDKINASIPTHISAAAAGDDQVLHLTASVAGTAGNAITVQTGSGQTITTTTLTLAGGVDATSDAKVLLGTIFPSKNTGTPDLGSTTLNDGHEAGNLTTNWNLELAGTGINSNTGLQISASINPANSNYIFKQLGDSPNNSKDGVVSYSGTPAYTYTNFKSFQTALLATGSKYSGYGLLGSSSNVFLVSQSADLAFSGEIGQNEGYGYASTPFITSQFLDANKTTKELFKFHTLTHGKTLSSEYKISIANLKEPNDIDGVEQYSTFNVLIRKAGDKDKSPVILEQFSGVTLDPDSNRYISRVIGDRYPQYNDTLGKVELLGNYPNISKYVRVEVSQPVSEKALSPKISPKGFKVVRNPINTSSFSQGFTVPSASYEGNQVIGSNFSSKAYLGFKFADKEADNINFLKPLPDSNEANVAGDFNVENYSGHSDSSLWSGSLSASVSTNGSNGPTGNQLKFSIPFQGGDDGIAPWKPIFTGAETTLADTYKNGTNLYGFDLSSTSANGYKAYKKALDILENQDEYDINMLAIPGAVHSVHSSVTNAGVDMCEERGDAFYVMDLNIVDASINTAVSDVSGLDTNYAAVYYPWVKVLDGSTNRPILVPPSVIVPGAIAASDAIGAEWFAPAGLNRGILGNVLEAKIRLSQSERDDLYNNKINPIATFPQTGVCIWGQKTLQERSTALDRINVRRLLITLKKFIASSSRYLVFEQNTLKTRTRFLNIVNPYLESVQQQQGLYAFRVQMDESNNTPTVIDRNELVGAIFLQPTKTAEFIVLDFNVMPTGATFGG